MIVGLSGKAQAGKDTVGEYLINTFGFRRIASADALKRIARNIFGWDSVKDDKGRKFLQNLGCAVREYNEDYWIGLVLDEISRGENFGYNGNVVITDVRFMNEVKLLKDRGAILWRIERPGIPLLDHYSEKELDQYDGFDSVINNVGTIDDLQKSVDAQYRYTVMTKESLR